MADGLSTSGLRKVTSLQDLDPIRNYILMDSDELNATARTDFSSFINLVIRTVASRLAESGLLPYVDPGVSLEDVRLALLDNQSDFILDEDGNLITETRGNR